MKPSPFKLRAIQVLFIGGVCFFAWKAVSLAASSNWPGAIIQLGFAVTFFSVVLNPSYVFGPSFPSLEEFKNLPTDHRLPKSARRFSVAGVALILVGFLLQAST